MAETKTDNLEKEFTIPLRKEWHKVPRYKRVNKAVKAIKEFLVRHMKIYDRDLRKIKIDKYLNEELWFRGIKKPPAKIKIKAIKENDIVRVELFELPEKLKFKKAREEKREQKAVQTKEKHAHAPGEEHEHKEIKPEEITEEKKIETEEKKAATMEAMQQIEKETARKMKHQKGGKTKEPKHRFRQALQK